MMNSYKKLVVVTVPVVYGALTIIIGWFARRKHSDANTLLNASRSLPLWIVSSAFLAANCGALEIVGISAMAAQYGVQAFHFYWIGAIPGMIFVSLWMIPAYHRSNVRSVPEYLEQRYDQRVKVLNACMLALVMVMLAGITLYALGQVLQAGFGLNFIAGVLMSTLLVLTYVLLGGVRATIYNEVFHLMMIIAGLLPLMFFTLRTAIAGRLMGGQQTHLWTALPLASRTVPLDMTGVVAGLGIVLSFSYWGTDFILMQRALAARTELDARKVPILAGFGKLVISFVLIVPGLAAGRLLPQLGTTMRYDEALPTLMAKLYSPMLLGVGLTAIIASLVSGLAANVSAFAAIWTEDLYGGWLRPGRSEAHYVRVGSAATIAAGISGALFSGVSFYFGNLMEHVQLLLSLFSAPFGAIFLLGVTTRRVNATGALAGFLSGMIIALVHHTLFWLGVLHYGSVMNANFHVAIYGFLTAIVIAWVTSRPASRAQTSIRISVSHGGFCNKTVRPLLLLAAILLSACIYLNVIWR